MTELNQVPLQSRLLAAAEYGADEMSIADVLGRGDMNTHRHGRSASADWWAAEDARFVESTVRLASSSRGVLLCGEVGAGQDELARRIAGRLASPVSPIDLAPPIEPAISRTLVGLVDDPPRVGPVFLIPDIEALAGSDLDAVARLMLRGSGIVVAVGVDRSRAVSAPLARLIDLELVRVGELPERSAAGFLEDGLGGPVSRRAAHAVWESGSGNRARMRLVVEDWLESSFLVRLEGVWIISGSVPPVGPRLIEHWRRRLDENEPAVRDVFETLSLAGELPLSDLLSVCDPDAVDDVYEAGLLTICGSRERAVTLRGTINLEAIASQVPPGRSRSLLDRVIGVLEERDSLPRPGIVAWRDRCALDSDVDTVLDSVESFHGAASPVQVLHLLRSLPPDVDAERIESARMAALLVAGPFADPSLFEKSGAPRSTAGSLHQSGSGQAADLLHASRSGDVRQILNDRRPPASLPGGSDRLRQQIIHEALAMSGKVKEGLSADRELVGIIERSELAAALKQTARLRLFGIEMMAGEWTRAAATLVGGWSDEMGSLRGEGEAVSRALSCVLTGDVEQSARLLERELPQLRVLGREDILLLGNSLFAVSLAALGRGSDARAALASVELPSSAGAGVWWLTWTASFFQARALGEIGRVGEAIDLLLTLADQDREWGRHTAELLALSAVLELGHKAVIDRLERAAQRTDSRFSRACRCVVEGMKSSNAELLDEGAAIARSVGQNSFADFVERQLEALKRSWPRSAAAQPGSSPRFPFLTPRQKQIVERVLSGQSNSAIASSIGVSVRTVESHLYQVYAKLDVADRADLRSALMATRPAGHGEQGAT